MANRKLKRGDLFIKLIRTGTTEWYCEQADFNQE